MVGGGAIARWDDKAGVWVKQRIDYEKMAKAAFESIWLRAY